MPNTFFTSDLHINHVKILEYTDRPYKSIEEMTEEIIKQWNSQVKQGDTCYHVGDLIFGLNKEENVYKFIRRLNGNIGFILGNHCKPSYYELAQKELGGKILFVEPFKKISVNKKSISMFHYAMMLWENSQHGTWSLFGHSHGSLEHPGKALDCGWDNAIKVLGEYRLFEFADIERYMNKKEIYFPDHHGPKTT